MITKLSHEQKMQVAQNIIDRQNGANLMPESDYKKVWFIIGLVQVLILVVMLVFPNL